MLLLPAQIGWLGPLEYILNTPSHHRVHHRPGANCNYAGVFIIWDRVFGTFRAEGASQEDRYGLGKQLHSFDPLRANVEHALRAAPSLGWVACLSPWRRRLRAEWVFQPSALVQPLPTFRRGLWERPKLNVHKYVGSSPPPSARRAVVEKAYLSMHMLLVLVGYVTLEARLKAPAGAFSPAAWLLAAWVLLSLCALGRLSDGDGSALQLETIRLLLLPLAMLCLASEPASAADPAVPAVSLMGVSVGLGAVKQILAAAVPLIALWWAVGGGWWVEQRAAGGSSPSQPHLPKEEEGATAAPAPALCHTTGGEYKAGFAVEAAVVCQSGPMGEAKAEATDVALAEQQQQQRRSPAPARRRKASPPGKSASGTRRRKASKSPGARR